MDKHTYPPEKAPAPININRYIFASEQIIQAQSILRRRKEIIKKYRPILQEYKKLCHDFDGISYTLINETKSEYDYSYYLACVDALVEINYRLHQIEERKFIRRKERKELLKLFKLTRSRISTFTGMRPVIATTVIGALVLIFIARFVNSYLIEIKLKPVIDQSEFFGYAGDFVYNLIYLLICVISGVFVLVFTTPVLKKLLTKSRVYREEQRNALYQITGIAFAILFVVWAFFIK